MKFEPAIYDGLLPYQPEGVDFLGTLGDPKHCFLWDDMRLGKAVQVIRAADALGARRVLVECKAIARIGWMRKFEQWGLVKRTVGVIEAQKGPIPDTDVLIINYDLAPYYADSLSRRQFNIGVVDEAQMIMTPTAKRTKASYGYRLRGRYYPGILNRCDVRWNTTGSPLKNHPGEMWTHLTYFLTKEMREARLPTAYWDFVRRYCEVIENPFGYKIVGKRDDTYQELREFLRPHMMRRLAANWLPPLTIEEVELPGKITRNDLVEMETGDDMVAHATRMRDAGVDQDEIDDYLTALLARVGQSSRFRRLSGKLKVAPVAELVLDELVDYPGKFIIFAWHSEVIDEYEKIFAEHKVPVVVIDGRRSPAQKQAAMDEFQNGAPRVAIGQIETVGTSIELHAADEAIFGEMSWVPDDNAQAMARMRDVMKTRPVRARFPSLAGTIDEAMTRVVTAKTKVVAAIIN